jgi:hypothetical protein
MKPAVDIVYFCFFPPQTRRTHGRKQTTIKTIAVCKTSTDWSKMGRSTVGKEHTPVITVYGPQLDIIKSFHKKYPFADKSARSTDGSKRIHLDAKFLDEDGKSIGKEFDKLCRMLLLQIFTYLPNTPTESSLLKRLKGFFPQDVDFLLAYWNFAPPPSATGTKKTRVSCGEALMQCLDKRRLKLVNLIGAELINPTTMRIGRFVQYSLVEDVLNPKWITDARKLWYSSFVTAVNIPKEVCANFLNLRYDVTDRICNTPNKCGLFEHFFSRLCGNSNKHPHVTPLIHTPNNISNRYRFRICARFYGQLQRRR